MLSHDQLLSLYRNLKDTRVLTVFLDGGTHDFSKKHMWKRRLEQVVGEARSGMLGADPEELRAFERAAGRIAEALGQFGAFIPDRAWAGFATADELAYSGLVHVPMSDSARWADGISVSAYVRALKQDRTVVMALVDSRRARLAEYRDGVMTELPDLIADRDVGEMSDENMSKRAGTHSGVRGETDTDHAQRLVRIHEERMLKELAQHLTRKAGKDGMVVVGGTPEVISHAISHLPSELQKRTLGRPSMAWHMTDAELVTELEAAASELYASLQYELLSGVIDQAKSGGRGLLGSEAVEGAIESGQVDTLLLSRTFVRTNPTAADRLVGAALEMSSHVEELSLQGADRLDNEAGGVAARLRYGNGGG